MRKIFYMITMLIVSISLASCDASSESTRVVDIKEDALTLEVGDTYQLDISINAPVGSYTQIRSTDSSVASVTEDGLVTALSVGATYIQIRNGIAFDYVVVNIPGDDEGIRVIYIDMLNEVSSVEAIDMGGALTLPEAPTFEGYNFIEWRTSLSDPASAVNEGDLVSSDLILFAYYEDSTSYTLAFDLKGGDGDVTDMSASLGDDITLPSAGDKTGFEFDSWSYNCRLDDDLNVICDTAEAGDTVTVSGDMKFYAQFNYVIPISAYEFDLIESNETNTALGYSIVAINDTSVFEPFETDNELLNISFPESYNDLPVIGIGEDLFADGYYFDKVTIPEGYQFIDSCAFETASMRELIIPDSLFIIESDAFVDSYVGKVTISDHSGLVVIESSAFENAKGFTTINIPDTLAYLGSSAFQDTDLTSIDLTQTVIKELNDDVFRGTNLTSFTVPNTVTRINEGAFQDTLITSMTIPSQVTRIESNAFDNSYLTSLTFEDATALTTVGYDIVNDTVYGYDANHFIIVDDILLKYDVRETGEDVSIPDGVLMVAEGAFMNANIKSLTLPSSLKRIESDAFSRIVISDTQDLILPDELLNISSHAFDRAFFGDGSTLTFNSDIQFLGYNSFYGVSGLSEVHFNDRSTPLEDPNWAYRSFRDSSVTTVTLGEGYVTLASEMFYNSSLETVTLPSTLKRIESNALNTPSLTTINGVSQLDLEHIGWSNSQYGRAFDLTAPYFTNQGAVDYYAFANVLISDSRSGAFTVPSGITVIAPYAVTGAVTSVDLTGATTVDSYAFTSFIAGMDVTVDETVNISYYIFGNNPNVNYVLPDGYFDTPIIDYNETDIEVTNTRFTIATAIKNYNMPVADANGFHIIDNVIFGFTQPIGFTGHIDIPEGIVEVYRFAFDNKGVTSVTFPSSLETIGYGAFRNNLMTGTLTLNEGLQKIESDGFKDNDIEQIIFPSTLKMIDQRVFSGNALTTLHIPSTLTFIGSGSFVSNPTLLKENITFEDVTSVTRFESMFENPTYYEDGFMIIDGVLLGVEEHGTLNTNLFIDLVIPDSVTAIGYYALSGTDARTIFIPNTVTYLGEGAFRFVNAYQMTFEEGSTFTYSEQLFEDTFIGVIVGDESVFDGLEYKEGGF